MFSAIVNLRLSSRCLWSVLSFGLWRRVFRTHPDVSEQHTASIFGIEEYVKHKTRQREAAASTLNIEQVYSPETSVGFYRTTSKEIVLFEFILWEPQVQQKGEILGVLNKIVLLEDVWGMEVVVHAFLTPPLDGVEWSARQPPLYPQKNYLRYPPRLTFKIKTNFDQ
jgi:hypothetical protein